MHLTDEQKTDVRTAALITLARARQSAFPASVIADRIRRYYLLDYQVTVAQVTDALCSLCQHRFASALRDPLTEELHYQVTPEGLAAVPGE